MYIRTQRALAVGVSERVDGLETSEYLKSVALSNIDGDISLKKAEELINSYYEQNDNHSSDYK